MSHLVVNSPHEVNVERFQSMASWCYEVEASVDQCIWHLRTMTMSLDNQCFQCWKRFFDLHANGLGKMATGYFSDLNSLHSGLSLQVSVKLLLDIRQDWSPASSEGFTGFVRYNDGSSHWPLTKNKCKPTCCQQRRHIQACQQQWERDELRSPQACTRGFPPAPRTSEATTARTSVTTRITTTTTKSPIPTATVQLYHVLLGFKEHLCLCQK